MFATLVKDINMAILAGVSPAYRPPTLFGEMYSTALPDSQLELLFGVKEWVRPAGSGKENRLVPNVPIKLPANSERKLMIKQLGW